MSEQGLIYPKDVIRTLDDRYGDLGLKFHYGTIYNSTKNNARKRNIPFELTRDEFDRMVMKTNGICPVSGWEFKRSSFSDFARNPFAPSIDRIDSSKGYTRKNCRIVCVMVNIAMNEWGEKMLVDMAKCIVEKRTRQRIAKKWTVRIEAIKERHVQKRDEHLESFKKDNEYLTAVDYVKRYDLSLKSGTLTTLATKYCDARDIPWYIAPSPTHQRCDLSWVLVDRKFFPESALAACVEMTQQRIAANPQQQIIKKENLETPAPVPDRQRMADADRAYLIDVIMEALVRHNELPKKQPIFQAV